MDNISQKTIFDYMGIEVLGDLNEFSIKKTVDLDEAKTKI